jgi:hypothetical protein
MHLLSDFISEQRQKKLFSRIISSGGIFPRQNCLQAKQIGLLPTRKPTWVIGFSFRIFLVQNTFQIFEGFLVLWMKSE